MNKYTANIHYNSEVYIIHNNIANNLSTQWRVQETNRSRRRGNKTKYKYKRNKSLNSHCVVAVNFDLYCDENKTVFLSSQRNNISLRKTCMHEKVHPSTKKLYVVY